MIKDGNALQQRARRVPGIIRYPIIAVAFVFPIYWMFTESGVYWWLSKQQAALFDGDFYPILSFLLSMLICLIPAGVIVHVLATFMGPKDQASTQNEQP